MKRYLPLVVIFLCALLFYLLGFYHYFTYDSLKAYHLALQSFVKAHPFLSPLLFITFYIAIAALSIPVALFLDLLAGFLFPQPLCTLYAVIGGTIGATLIFLAAQTALHDVLKKRAAPFFKKMKKGFNNNATGYLLFLRLVHVFPFWIVNLVPAFFNVRLFTYIWTTCVGIIPATFVYTQAGVGLRTILESKEAFSVDTILNFHMRIALIALGVLSLTMIWAKKLWEKR